MNKQPDTEPQLPDTEAYLPPAAVPEVEPAKQEPAPKPARFTDEQWQKIRSGMSEHEAKR